MDLPDLLLIDKPAGMTSFDVIRQLRRKLKIRKMGHAGTLDPAATGLMLIGVGPGTKQLADFIKLDKEYLAEVLVGVRTTSGDLDGEVLEQVNVPDLDEPTVEMTVSHLVGDLTLPVSAYSAIKAGGQPLYKKARAAAAKGEPVPEGPLRKMAVHDAAYLGMHREGEWVVLTVRFSVGSGTYIRSLAEELGRLLGYPATLKSLRRTMIGIFDVSHAKRLDEVESVELSE